MATRIRDAVVASAAVTCVAVAGYGAWQQRGSSPQTERISVTHSSDSDYVMVDAQILVTQGGTTSVAGLRCAAQNEASGYLAEPSKRGDACLRIAGSPAVVELLERGETPEGRLGCAADEGSETRVPPRTMRVVGEFEGASIDRTFTARTICDLRFWALLGPLVDVS